MATYIFRELCAGPSWRIIKDDFSRRSQGEAFARDWLATHGYAPVLIEADNVHDGVDFMMSRGNALYQFAIDAAPNAEAGR